MAHLTPVPFTLRQDEKYLFIQLDLPNDTQNPEKADYHIDEHTFMFFLKPHYHLKLIFGTLDATPPLLNECGETNMTVYNPLKQCITCRIEKLKFGQMIPDLEHIQNTVEEVISAEEDQSMMF